MTRLRYFGQATRVLRYSNWIAAAVVTLFATHLHVLFAKCRRAVAGRSRFCAFVAAAVTVRRVANLGYDHCPILMPLAMRAWSAAGLGNTDLGLRALGLCVGLFFAALNKITAAIIANTK
jgi:hypothetical protein